MPAPDAMTCDKLAKLVGTPRAPVILDVRRDALRAEDPRTLPAARLLTEAQITPLGAAELVAGLRGQAVVVARAAGLGLYDALYRWARDATEETHTWPGSGRAK